jgi:hypothetical protein
LVRSRHRRFQEAATVKTLGFLELLKLRGVDPSRKAKLARHQDARYDVADLLRRGWFEAYQNYQQKRVFDGLDYVVSFVGAGGTKARFVGVYRVAGYRPSEQEPLQPGCPIPELQTSGHFYDLRKEPGYEDLEHRVIIEWGAGALAWHQTLREKPVLEIRPQGQLLELFDDYLGFALSFGELQYLFRHADANAEWRARLSAVAGVYLAQTTTTGQQYVGSAYGAEGVWGRWAQYAVDGHGGNVLLKELKEKDPAYPKGLWFSLLQILPRTLARAEVLEWERRYKEKLGSRATGLNSN